MFVVLAVGMLLLLAWVVVAGALAAGSALALRSAAQTIAAAADRGDSPAVARALLQAQSHADRLDRRLSSAPLSWTAVAPVIGPTVGAGAELAGAADDVLTAARPILPAIEAAAEGSLLTAAADLRPVGDDLRQTAEAASDAVRQVDTAAVIWPLRDPVESARTQLAAALDALAQGAGLAVVVPDMLGVGEPARWLVVLAQPSEARGSGGGFYGAYLTLDVADGRFALGRAAANGPERLAKQDLGALPAEYRRLWGSEAQYLWGFNHSRHFPYSASVIAGALDPSADYVVSLNPRVVAGLLALSGPVMVDGTTIDAGNAESFFTRDVYIRYPDPAMKDSVTLAALQQVFAALASVDEHSPAQWWEALGGPIAQGQLQVWSPDPAAAQVLQGSAIGGAVPDEAAPWVTAAFNNAAGNKIDSYVSTEIGYSVAGACEAGPVSGVLTAQLDLDPLPPGLPRYIAARVDGVDGPYGTTAMLVHLYGPPGAVGRGPVTVNGIPMPAVAGMERGHPVWGVKVQLAPDEPVTVRAEFDQPPYAGLPLVVGPQPMVRDTVIRIDDQRTCRTR